MQYYFTTIDNVTQPSSSQLQSPFPYKINNNLNGSFSFNAPSTDTNISANLFIKSNNSLWYTQCDSTYVGNGMKRYTYRIHWGRTLAMLTHREGTLLKLFWDRNGIFTDELLNYEDTELIEAVRSVFNANNHKFCSYNFVNTGGNSNVDTLLNYSIFSPSIYAVFAMNANDNNFMSCPLYNAMYLSSYNTPIKNTYTSIVMVPIMEMNSFSLGKFTQASVQNSIQDIYDIQNNANFAKKFLGYYKAPTAFNLNDAGNYFANWFNPASQISTLGLRYCNFGLSGGVQKKCVAFQMVMTSYVNNFRIPFDIPITTNYTYTPSSPTVVSSTQLEHIHLAQVFDYKLGMTSAPYTSLLAQFGLNKDNWSNLTTYYYNAGKVNMGFADGFIIQSPYNSDSKIYYGSTLPYLYDGFVDWNIQNRTALNAKMHYGLTGAIGNVLGTFAHITSALTPSAGTIKASNNYQDSLSWGRTFAYDTLQWIKGAPSYSQQIRQAQISNPANLITNADASGCYADIAYYFNATYNKRAVTFEMSKYDSNVIRYANEWLKMYGFGGVPRYMGWDAKPTNYSGYVRLSKHNANVPILRKKFLWNYESWIRDPFVSQFVNSTFDEIILEAYEWMTGGYYQ